MAKGVQEDLTGISSYELADGTERWRVRLRIHGARVSESCETKEQAIELRDSLTQARRNGTAPEKMPVKPKNRGGRLAQRTVVSMIRDEWWPVDAQRRLDQRTRWTYKSHLKNWIYPSPLGRMDPTRVTAQSIYAWQDWAGEKEASPASIRKAQTVLSAAFKWAARRSERTGVIANPVAGVEWPKESRGHEINYFSFEVSEWCRQWLLHDETCRNRRLRRQSALLFSLMQGTGMRPSEARQTTPAMFDSEFGVLELPGSVSKNGKSRVMPLWSPTREEVEAFVSDFDVKPREPLIANAVGEPMSFSGWERWRDDHWLLARRWVSKHLNDENLRTARAYDVCRHRYASAQLAALMPLTDLADIMGHSVAMLSSTYARPIASARERRRRDKKPLDPEAELATARAQVAGEIKKISAEKLVAPPP